jgi:HD-like signal output (HDOD) protein
VVNILFVDDEPLLLEGLRNALRRQRHAWNMRFVTSGAGALEALAAEPFAIVVSDMRMPGMDGAELLTQVRDRWPHVARLILSGQADQDAVERALPVTQQFLAKPCDSEMLTRVLTEIIETTVSRPGGQAEEKARALVTKVPNPPVLQAHFDAVEAVLGRRGVSHDDLRGIMEGSPVMTMRVLRLVNSKWFGAAAPIVSVADALPRLGPELLRGVVLSVHTTAPGEVGDEVMYDMRQLARHVRLLSRLMRRLLAGHPDLELGATAAILHDMGRVVVAMAAPADGRQVDYVSRQGGQARQEIEIEITGVRHAEVGAAMLRSWNLPASLVELVRGHALPALAGPEAPPDVLAPLHVAHARLEAAGLGSGGTPHTVDLGYLERHGLTGQLAGWHAIMDEEIEAALDPAAA